MKIIKTVLFDKTASREIDRAPFAKLSDHYGFELK